MQLKNWTLAALFCAAIPGVSQARDTTLFPDFQAAVQEATSAGRLDGSVKFYLAGVRPAGKVNVIKSGVATNKKTNAFNKTDEGACSWALQSALITLQSAANAVVNLASNYKKVEYKNAQNYECHAGAIIAGVALKGDLAKVK